MDTSTQDLIQAVWHGDIDRYERLVEQVHESVWRSVAGFGLDREAIRDVVQEAFIDAYRQLGTFRSGADFGAWVRGIARNLARKELRRRSCRYRHEDRYRRHVEQRMEADEEPDERLAALQRCRERLPDDSRQAIQGFYEQGAAIESIAAALGRSAAAAKQLLWRSRLALRRCIEGSLEAEP